jgi:predicted transcriptional regulator
MVSIKEEARHLIETLPEGATWEDLMERIYVRKTIEAGLADVEAGRTVPLEEVRKRYGLEP